MKLTLLFLVSTVLLGPGVLARAEGLGEVAQSPKYAWSGVTVSKKGRVFVEFPRFQNQKGNPSVAELSPDRTLKPYPGGAWNQWVPGKPVGNAFVSTNSLHIFDQDPDFLWGRRYGGPFFWQVTRRWPQGGENRPAHELRGARLSARTQRRAGEWLSQRHSPR